MIITLLSVMMRLKYFLGLNVEVKVEL